MLRVQRVGILQFAANAVFSRQVFRGNAHVIIVEGIPQTVMYQAVDQLAVPQLSAGAAIGKNMRGTAHILLPARNHNVGFAALNSLGRQMQRFQARTADIVNGDGGNGIG